MKPRLNELFTMIGMELKKSGFATQTPAGLVITGGGALTVGAEESAKRMLSMPVRIGVPVNITGLIDDVENPCYATAVGLLVYGRNFRTVEHGGMFEGIFGMIPGAKSGNITLKVKKMLKNFIP